MSSPQFDPKRNPKKHSEDPESKRKKYPQSDDENPRERRRDRDWEHSESSDDQDLPEQHTLGGEA